MIKIRKILLFICIITATPTRNYACWESFVSCLICIFCPDCCNSTKPQTQRLSRSALKEIKRQNEIRQQNQTSQNTVATIHNNSYAPQATSALRYHPTDSDQSVPPAIVISTPEQEAISTEDNYPDNHITIQTATPLSTELDENALRAWQKAEAEAEAEIPRDRSRTNPPSPIPQRIDYFASSSESNDCSTPTITPLHVPDFSNKIRYENLFPPVE